jgi:hypothetical protein
VFDLTLENDGWSMINVTQDGLSQRATARFSDGDTIDVTGPGQAEARQVTA